MYDGGMQRLNNDSGFLAHAAEECQNQDALVRIRNWGKKAFASNDAPTNISNDRLAPESIIL
jgi:hypothetical protein